ncbi:MAG: hypothetical protein ACK2T3_13280 [Candidatus Promineifilaceae bacterium]|jgi:hypothetical protein
MTRKEWIIGIIAGLTLAAVVLVILFTVLDLGGSSAPAIDQVESESAPSETKVSGTTSMQAYQLAMEAAQEWHDDAQLIRVNSTWSRGTSRETIMTGENSWTLGFYSPGANSAANFEVLDGEVRLANDFELKQTLSPDDVKQWRVDSKVAILRLLDEGGDNFLNKNGLSTLKMSLSIGEQGARPEWFMVMLGTEPDNSMTMRLDATTGEVLETVKSS